ncbi:MAG: metal-dependent hydrolase [Polyangiaceae bacterium]|nr:metal-dependent hydrolase [Polyangiaceae bacterium]
MAGIGHIAVGLACARAYSEDRTLRLKPALIFSALALWPDADALGFLLGVGYGESMGHRGATHSLAVGLFVVLGAYIFAQRRGLAPLRTAGYVAIATLSHCLLDTVTYGGGLGCALLWPLSDARFWSPVRFIPISPIGVAILSARGFKVMAAEVGIFLPLWLYALWPRRRRAPAAP